MLLDEPTTGLDPQARHLLWERLYQLKSEGVTQVLTTHYMDEAEQLCDRLVIMDEGRIVGEGSPRELIAAHSTREVVELRFADDRARADAVERIDGLADRVEELADRVLLYTDDGDASPRTARPTSAWPRPRPWCGGPASRTSSSGSPAGPSRSSDGDTDPAPRRRARGARVPQALARRRRSPSFVGPMLFLGAMGLGLGALRRRRHGCDPSWTGSTTSCSSPPVCSSPASCRRRPPTRCGP